MGQHSVIMVKLTEIMGILTQMMGVLTQFIGILSQIMGILTHIRYLVYGDPALGTDHHRVLSYMLHTDSR